MKKLFAKLIEWTIYLTGLGLICVGVGLISLPIGLIVSGVLISVNIMLYVSGVEKIKKEKEPKEPKK